MDLVSGWSSYCQKIGYHTDTSQDNDLAPETLYLWTPWQLQIAQASALSSWIGPSPRFACFCNYRGKYSSRVFVEIILEFSLYGIPFFFFFYSALYDKLKLYDLPPNFFFAIIEITFMTCDTCKGFNEYLVSFSVSCEVLPYLIRVEDMSLFHQLPTTEGKHRRGIILLMHVALMVSGSGLMILLSLQLVLAKYCMTMLMCSSISNYNQSWIPVNSFSADPVGCLCDFHCIQEK